MDWKENEEQFYVTPGKSKLDSLYLNSLLRKVIQKLQGLFQTEYAQSHKKYICTAGRAKEKCEF